MSNRTEQTMSVFGIMSLAAMIGALAALLLAPRKGSETRERLKLRMHNARIASEDAIDDTKVKAQHSLDKLRRKADDTAEDVSDMVTDARSQAEDVIADRKIRARKTGDTSLM